eukprot:gene28797-34764_t
MWSVSPIKSFVVLEKNLVENKSKGKLVARLGRLGIMMAGLRVDVILSCVLLMTLVLIFTNTSPKIVRTLRVSTEKIEINSSINSSAALTYLEVLEVSSANQSTKNSSLDWQVVGGSLTGTAAQDYFGYSVSLNHEGNVLIVSAPNRNQGRGETRVYGRSGEEWRLLGTLGGDEEGDNAVYELDFLNVLRQRGSNLEGEVTALSYSGDIVVVGSYKKHNYSGEVAIFSWDQPFWKQVGQSFVGASEYDYLGSSVAISMDGSRVAFGAPNEDFGNGIVRVQEWNNVTWIQLGESLKGSGYFGYTVALNDIGSLLAVGSITANFDRGEVQVFSYSGSSWIGRTLAPFEGDLNFGVHISMSAAGNYLAAGAYTSAKRGKVRLYFLNGADWQYIGHFNDVLKDDSSNFSFKLRADGEVIALGQPGFDYAGVSNRGKFDIYAQPVYYVAYAKEREQEHTAPPDAAVLAQSEVNVENSLEAMEIGASDPPAEVAANSYETMENAIADSIAENAMLNRELPVQSSVEVLDIVIPDLNEGEELLL